MPGVGSFLPLLPLNTLHPNADKVLHVCVPIIILLYTPGISAICVKRQKELHREKKKRNRGRRKGGKLARNKLRT
jgi:hypothetical protein